MIAFRTRSLGYHARQIFQNGYAQIEDSDGRKSLLQPGQRRFVETVSRTVNLPSYLRRKAIGAYVAAKYPGLARIRDGYAMTTAAASASKRVIALCERQVALYEAFVKQGPGALEKPTRSKYVKEARKDFEEAFLHIPFRYDPQIAGELAAFCLRPEFLSVVARYLGVLPVLAGVRIIFSPNETSDHLRYAQLFHVDPEGARQVKLLMAVRKIDSQSGPFTFIPASATLRMRLSGKGKFERNRVADKYVLKHVRREKWVSFHGRPGDVLFVDTSNCYHFGSRPGAKPRLLLYAQFVDPFGSHLPAVRAPEVLASSWANLPPIPGRWSEYLLGRRI